MSKTISILPFPGANFANISGTFTGALVLTGLPGVGKSTYCMQFAHDGLVNGEPVVYVSTDDPPAQIRQQLRRFGPVPVQEEKMVNLRIVDNYSWRTGVFEEQYTTTNPNLSELSLVISKAREGISNFRFVIDSISGLAVEASMSSLVKFLQVTFGRLKSVGSTGVFVIESGAHEQQLVSYMRFISDGVLEMSLVEEQGGALSRRFRIFCLRRFKHSTNWIAFSIDEEGLRLEV